MFTKHCLLREKREALLLLTTFYLVTEEPERQLWRVAVNKRRRFGIFEKKVANCGDNHR